MGFLIFKLDCVGLQSLLKVQQTNAVGVNMLLNIHSLLAISFLMQTSLTGKGKRVGVR